MQTIGRCQILSRIRCTYLLDGECTSSSESIRLRLIHLSLADVDDVTADHDVVVLIEMDDEAAELDT